MALLCGRYPASWDPPDNRAGWIRENDSGRDHIRGAEPLVRRGNDDPFRLSRGELRRFQIACLSLRDWDLLVFDEPFSGLDCREKQKESRRISALSSRIVLVFTHEQRYLPRTDYLWEMRDGVLNYLGTVPEALPFWETAPVHVRMLLEKGIIPANLTEEDLEEGLCRMQG